MRIPREIVLIPIAMLWVLLVWNAKVEDALAHGDTYLMPREIRDNIVWYFGYLPVILQGIVIFVYLAGKTSNADAPAQSQS